MAYATDKSDFFHGFHGVRNTSVAPRVRARHAVRVLRRLTDAISAWWNTKGDDAEIVALLERTGGRLTDSVEREMLERRTHSSFY